MLNKDQDLSRHGYISLLQDLPPFPRNEDGAPVLVFLLVARRGHRREILRRCPPLGDGVWRRMMGSVGRRIVRLGGEACRGKAAAEPQYSKKTTAFHRSSFYKTSHPTEERRMGHPVLFLGFVIARTWGSSRGVTVRRSIFLSCDRGRSRRIWRRQNRRCRIPAR